MKKSLYRTRRKKRKLKGYLKVGHWGLFLLRHLTNFLLFEVQTKYIRCGAVIIILACKVCNRIHTHISNITPQVGVLWKTTKPPPPPPPPSIIIRDEIYAVVEAIVNANTGNARMPRTR